MIVVGIDLAGSEKRDTGFCVLDERKYCSVRILHSDAEIIESTLSLSPDVISIDAPLFLPKGRTSLEQRGPPHLRECDKALMRMKIRFFPITLGPMRMLTRRGIELRTVFESKGMKVIESYPGAIQDLMGMPRKQAGTAALRSALASYGITGDISRDAISGDELDAITSAIVGKMYLEGDYEAIGVPEEGLMIIPKTGTAQKTSRHT